MRLKLRGTFCLNNLYFFHNLIFEGVNYKNGNFIRS